MLGILNNEQIDHLLHSQYVGRIGCHAEGITYVVPVIYVFDGKYIIGHTNLGMKVNMLRQNPEVCFEIDEVKNMAHWQSAIIWGRYEELSGSTALDAMEQLATRLMPVMTSETNQPSHGVFADQPVSGVYLPVIYRIVITKKTGRFEGGGS